MKNEITIYYEDIPVATIDSKLSLRYEEKWLRGQGTFPISLAMPLNETTYEKEKIMTWLSNLLPEKNLEIISKFYKISETDILEILKKMGSDTSGALSIRSSEELPKKKPKYIEIKSETDLKKIIDKLPERPFLIGEEGISMSLPGVQTKLAVHIENNKFYLPINGAPSTFILKPESHTLAGTVQNEAFCMTLAKLSGLMTADIDTKKIKDRSILLIKRFDRIEDSGKIHRIHQEDMCQLLGILPSMKYEKGSIGMKGASLKNMFDAIKNKISPGERLKLLDAVIYNILIGNSDSHAKNYTIQITRNKYRLSPLYDLLSTLPYKNIDKTLSQSINSKFDASILHGRDWEEMAKECDLSPSKTRERVEELGEIMQSNIDEAAKIVYSLEAGANEFLQTTIHSIRKRIKRIISQTKENNYEIQMKL